MYRICFYLNLKTFWKCIQSWCMLHLIWQYLGMSVMTENQFSARWRCPHYYNHLSNHCSISYLSTAQINKDTDNQHQNLQWESVKEPTSIILQISTHRSTAVSMATTVLTLCGNVPARSLREYWSFGLKCLTTFGVVDVESILGWGFVTMQKNRRYESFTTAHFIFVFSKFSQQISSYYHIYVESCLCWIFAGLRLAGRKSGSPSIILHGL